MYYVYLIESISIGKYYIGQTANVDKRVKRHNCGYVKSTKAYRPWKLIGIIEVQNRKEAMALEKKIKDIKKRELQLTYFQKSPGSEK